MLTALMTGCGFFDKKEEDFPRKWAAEKLFREAKGAATQRDYETAIDYYQKLETRYPFGRLAEQASLELAYAYYKYEEPELSLIHISEPTRPY